MSTITLPASGDQPSHTSMGRTAPGAARRQIGLLVLYNLLGIAGLVLLLVPPIAQNVAYHAFHDDRPWLGIPNALNVLSNVPFVIIGLLGLSHIARSTEFTVPVALRHAYNVLFAGMLLTGLGSAYYHWSPDSRTLVWDRLPMTLAFMGLFAAILGERVALGLGSYTLLPLVAMGLASVGWWIAYDDLRPYGIVQYYPLLAIPVLLWAFPANYTKGGAIVAALGCYIVAKLLEDADGSVFALGGVVSGHTLKHLAAAVGGWCLYRMLVSRRPVHAAKP